MNLDELNKVARGHGGARQGHSRRRRILRHHQEALRRHRRGVDGRQSPRLSRDAVPLGRRHEAHLRRHPLRRDHLAEGEGRHAAGRTDQARGRDPRHQGRRRHQAAAVLPRRSGHRRPRQARRPAAEILRAGRALRQMARGDRHRRRHPELHLHQRQCACAGALRRALPGGADRADRRAGSADGRRPRHRPLLSGDRMGAQERCSASSIYSRVALEGMVLKPNMVDPRQEERQARRRSRKSPRRP